MDNVRDVPQYKVQNGRGNVYYITASPYYVQVK
ncbi:N-acetylmuramoyl-L-alanine amidase [Bacillus pseudomycoides]|nr:N-acetylmuramoyl-L-alanine amidase [Bacillus pseudomycoides]PEK81726.1 N-acetylmuramoyl-L-alanine amidase [Bacillus pseudomycoides]PEN00727.1 N-acetylmuramoyl-L-alanine amidase [Bacillus pseudomycoides]PHE53714.1 N-acetylmuramoyl-L-alanine amidase [Bacillus pseudomycoides]